MGKAIRRKIVIEITYESRTDAIELLKEIHYKNIGDLKEMKRFLGTADMEVKRSIVKPIIEPRIETIDGNKCLIFPSSMNF